MVEDCLSVRDKLHFADTKEFQVRLRPKGSGVFFKSASTRLRRSCGDIADLKKTPDPFAREAMTSQVHIVDPRHRGASAGIKTGNDGKNSPC